MKIVTGNDHAGFELKGAIVTCLAGQGHEVIDCGSFTTESMDFPVSVKRVITKLRELDDALGILVCGTGVGMSIAANKYDGIRAALVHDLFTARMTREHNDSNVLCLGARVISEDDALNIVNTWLSSSYLGGKYDVRNKMIRDIEVTEQC